MENSVPIIIIIGLALAVGGCLLKLYHIKNKVIELTDALKDVEINNINRKTLIKETDMLAPLVYQVNGIIYSYEEKLRDLEVADETSKQLMTSLSHDVRTPLTTLIGYLDAAHNGLVVGAERERIDMGQGGTLHDLRVFFQ